MIGGEFPITATDILNAENKHSVTSDVYMYSSGRAAFYQIIKHLKQEKSISRILLPDYICSSVLIPIVTLGLEYVFYPIDENLELQAHIFNNLYQKDSAVLIVNYFGLKDLSSQIRAIRSIDEHAIIIEDDVMAYYEFKKPLDGVDFKFTSLRKTFAVPDGGLVKSKKRFPIIDTPNTFGQYKAAASLLKSMRDGNFNDQIYLDLFEKGESLINSEMECGISQIAMKLFSFVDEERVKVRRINNAEYLINELKKLGITPILPLTKNHVPLFVPVILKDRDAVRKALFQKEIFCPIHWPKEGMDIQKGSFMANNELSLIIDQRYGIKEMKDILEVLCKQIN